MKYRIIKEQQEKIKELEKKIQKRRVFKDKRP